MSTKKEHMDVKGAPAQKKGWLSAAWAKSAPWCKKGAQYVCLVAAGLCALPYAVDQMLSGRPLNNHEAKILRPLFKGSLDYSKIKIHSSAVTDLYLSAHGAAALAFNNTIICKDQELDDYELLHEAVHIWQHRNAADVSLHAPWEAAVSFLTTAGKHGLYDYTLEPGKKLAAYGVEQQASIIADFYSVKQGRGTLFLQNNVFPVKRDILYRDTLSNFLNNPAYLQQTTP